MKNLIKYIFAGAFILGCSCQISKKQAGNFSLLPQTQEFIIKGKSKLKPKDLNLEETEAIEFLKSGIDQSLNINKEGYLLEIRKNEIILTGKDRAGLFYGMQTLAQLKQDALEMGINLPQCNITDYPALPYRAIHLDIKHHREKLEYYYALMDWLASYKINAIIAEVEDKIRYEKQPLVGSEDAISIEEWQKLSDYAIERNIEISPLVQGLGHASFILKHDEYKHLRDNPDSDWAFHPLDPETYKVQFDLYLDAIEATPHGRYLHVGGDEVHTTGRSSGKSALELQLIWLDKVCKFAEENGRIPIFWDDMPLKHAGLYQPMFNKSMTQKEVDSIWDTNEHRLEEFLDRFPKNCIYMRWNYSNPETFGNIKAMQWFREHGLKVMGATAGQTRWVLMPQNESNMDAIRNFAIPSIESGLNGLLLTLWDDDSPHFELYKRGIIAFAEYTWAGDIRIKEEIKHAYRQREFGIEAGNPDLAFIDQLERPVAFWKNALLKGNKRNYLLREEYSLDNVIELPDPEKKGAWAEKHEQRLWEAEKHLENCDKIAAKIDEMKLLAARNNYTLSIYEQVNNLVSFSNKALLLLKEFDSAEDELQRSAALSKIRNLCPEFKTIRSNLEEVYSVTRILDKPDNYILDQDHHVHLANQAMSFDWQFVAEMLFLEKVEKELLN